MKLAILAVLCSMLLAACATMDQLGGGNDSVHGAAAGSSSTDANHQLEHCDKPLGTLAVEEDTAQDWYLILTTQYRLPATTPLLRLMIQQSNCFVVVDRGRAMNIIQGERGLALSGQLRHGSNMGNNSQMVGADYAMTPTIQFAQNTGGAGVASAVAQQVGGSLAGALVGGMKRLEASTTLMLTDTRTGVQVAASQGSASKMDFGLGVLGVGSSGGAAIGAYDNTPEGKVIASAFMDSYNQMVRAVRSYAPQRVVGGLGTGGHLHVAGDGSEHTSVTDAQRALSELGLYSGKVDGIDGPGTRAAISKFQRIRGLPTSGELDVETAQALAQ